MAWAKGKKRDKVKGWRVPDTITIRGVRWDVDGYIDEHYMLALSRMIDRINANNRNTAGR